MIHTQPPLTTQTSRPESSSVHLRGVHALGDRVVVATWPSTSPAGLSSCLRGKSRFARSSHSSWGHNCLGSGRFLGLWGTLDLDASWAFGGGHNLDASWAFGGHGSRCFLSLGGTLALQGSAGWRLCPIWGSSCDWIRVWSHEGPGPRSAQRSHCVLMWTRPAWQRWGDRECWSPQRKLSWDPRPLGAGRGAVPIKSWAQTRWDPGCLPTAGSGAGPPEEQGLDQYLLSE